MEVKLRGEFTTELTEAYMAINRAVRAGENGITFECTSRDEADRITQELAKVGIYVYQVGTTIEVRF